MKRRGKAMAIETKFLMGDGELGSRLQLTVTHPDLATADRGTMASIINMHPVRLDKLVDGMDGVYVFPRYGISDKSLDARVEVAPETEDIISLTVTGIRIE